MRRTCLLLVSLFVSACASGHSQFYFDLTNGDPSRDFQPASAEPEIVSSSGDSNTDIARMWEQGFGLLGYSSFNGTYEDNSAILAQAVKVGAEKVIAFSEHTGTTTTQVPFSTSEAVTTYESGTATATGSGGWASGSYSGTSTTYVPQTTYIPVTTSRYDQSALFFARLRPPCIGVLFGAPTDELRRQLQLNAVLPITAVRSASPAYLANVLPGDLLLSVDGMPFVEDSNGNYPTSGRSNQAVELGIARPDSYGSFERLSIPVVLGVCD